MIARSSVSFERLQQLLLDLGFTQTKRGDFWVFAASKEKHVLSTIELGNPISATVTAANGVLYVATMTRLYAIAGEKKIR